VESYDSILFITIKPGCNVDFSKYIKDNRKNHPLCLGGCYASVGS
jgi:hypothetical protein